MVPARIITYPMIRTVAAVFRDLGWLSLHINFRKIHFKENEAYENQVHISKVPQSVPVPRKSIILFSVTLVAEVHERIFSNPATPPEVRTTYFVRNACLTIIDIRQTDNFSLKEIWLCRLWISHCAAVQLSQTRVYKLFSRYHILRNPAFW